jgi:ribosomal protein S18 acetylase RimI-like enzyme
MNSHLFRLLRTQHGLLGRRNKLNQVRHRNGGYGLSTAKCAKLSQVLLQTVEHIGSNVKADNASAIASYKRLGFEGIATYEEYSCSLKPTKHSS